MTRILWIYLIAFAAIASLFFLGGEPAAPRCTEPPPPRFAPWVNL